MSAPFGWLPQWMRRERRAAKPDPSWDAIRLHPSLSSMNLSAAEGITTVGACVQAVAGGVGSLPALVYRREGDTRLEAPDHPLAKLVREGPNKWQTWPEFIEWWVASALMHGNGLVEITPTGELVPIPWNNAGVRLLPNGRLVYDVTDLTTIYGGTGRLRTLLDTEVLHLRDRSDDGLVGRSRLHRAAAAMGAVVATQQFVMSLYENGARPSGALKTPHKLSDDAYNRLRKQWNDRHAGAANAGRTAILEEGLDWQGYNISAEQQELLARSKFGAEEMARLFGVPPPLVGIWDNSTFTNSETAGRWFATHTLAPWCVKIQAEVQRKLLGDSAELVIDLSGLLRGSPLERWQTYDIASKHGILTPNEIREQEGWNPRAGGNTLSMDTI